MQRTVLDYYVRPVAQVMAGVRAPTSLDTMMAPTMAARFATLARPVSPRGGAPRLATAYIQMGSPRIDVSAAITIAGRTHPLAIGMSTTTGSLHIDAIRWPAINLRAPGRQTAHPRPTPNRLRHPPQSVPGWPPCETVKPTRLFQYRGIVVGRVGCGVGGDEGFTRAGQRVQHRHQQRLSLGTVPSRVSCRRQVHEHTLRDGWNKPTTTGPPAGQRPIRLCTAPTEAPWAHRRCWIEFYLDFEWPCS